MTTPLRIVYAGTPEFAVPALEALLNASHQVVAVYTQPDRPAGRGRVLTASPVKACALTRQLTVEQPATLRDADAIERLRSYRPEVMVVAAYGLILPQSVLDIPTHGCINIHASLLPRWRGAAPIQRAILEGDTHTGVTLMRMEAGLDTGPMLRKKSFEIGAHETAGQLQPRLAALGAQLLTALLNEPPDALSKGEVQPAEGVSYAHKLHKSDALIDWQRTSSQLDRQVRAFNPWPVAETTFNGQQLRIWEARRSLMTHAVAPGSVIRAGDEGIEVACGDGTVLSLLTIQQAGRKALPATDFLKSHDLHGVQLGVTA